MIQHPGAIVTVPEVENDTVDPVIVLFGALAEENGDPDSMIGRRSMLVDTISVVRLFAPEDVGMTTPILVFQIPVQGMRMGLIEDLCDAALEWHDDGLGRPFERHGSWHATRCVDGVDLRPDRSEL